MELGYAGKAGLRGLRMVGVHVPGVRVPAELLLAGLRAGVPPNMGERPSIGERSVGGFGMGMPGVRGAADPAPAPAPRRSWWRTLPSRKAERRSRRTGGGQGVACVQVSRSVVCGSLTALIGYVSDALAVPAGEW